MSITTIAATQTVTTTGALSPTTGLDISGVSINQDATVHLRITKFSSAASPTSAAIVLEDSVNAFTAAIAVAERQIAAPISQESEVHLTFRKYELPSCRYGVPGAVLRWNITRLLGTSPSLTIDSWLEQ